MRKNLLFLIPVFMMVCFPLSAQQVGTAEKNSAELQTKLDSTLERINELRQMSREQLDSLVRKNIEDMHKPIESAPKAGGRVNGHVLDADGNPIANKEVRICGRDFVDRAVTITNADQKDGFFMLIGIKSTDNYLSFEADGYEKLSFPIDRGTYEIRLKPIK
jgi:hypothetical protein